MDNFYYSAIKLDNGLRFGLIYNPLESCVGAAVYTLNEIQAAPVTMSKKADKITDKKNAIIINSGNANCFTGKKGIETTETIISAVEKHLKLKSGEVYTASTGVIGQVFPPFDIDAAVKDAVDKLEKNNESAFANSILTTDTRIKLFKKNFNIDNKEIEIIAIAKGAGMIMPDMATMLSCVLTNVKIEKTALLKALQDSCDKTLNCLSIDGDTSTNDTVFSIADGSAGNNLISLNSDSYKVFCSNLTELLTDVAKAIVNDGEGITKFITIDIKNTPTRDQAKAIAFSIANSPLVKTAFYGESFNWGRIMMAIGKVKTGLDYSLINMFINDVKVLENGEFVLTENDESKIELSLKNHDIEILIDFAQGNEEIRVWTCDFSLDYVKINADYLS